MENNRKLKRGLSDVSPGFFSAGTAGEAQPKNLPAIVTSSLLARPIQNEGKIRCLSILPFGSENELLQNGFFTAQMKKMFGELCSARIGSNEPWLAANHGHGIRQVSLSVEQAQEILHLQPAGHDSNMEPEERYGNLGVLFDPVSLFEHERNLLQILDDVILHVKTDSPESLIKAYQSFRACLEWNPSLRFLLLVDGERSEHVSDLVYERFAQITSKFMSYEIGFMGWIDGSRLQVNEGLFSEELDSNLLWKPSKKILAKILRRDLLHYSL